MPVVVRSLGSGSSGNALVISDGDAAIAVDCGLGPRSLVAGSAAAGFRLADLTAVCLTHEHVDHVRGMAAIARAGVRIIATSGTARASRVPASLWEAAPLNQERRAGPFTLLPLGVSHDAAEPCGFSVATGQTRVTVVTDLGCADAALHDVLAASDLIVLEANHDETMLRRGPYPAHLKRRVLSATGHLSNHDCGRLLAAALHDAYRTRAVWLAHLSQTNNRPALARATVATLLAAEGIQLPIIPMPRHGHDLVWRADQPDALDPTLTGDDAAAPPVQLALAM